MWWMKPNNLLLILTAVIVVVLGPKGMRELAQGVAEGLSNWRRPGPPTHPLPADDSKILNRRRKSRLRNPEF